jgi:AMMECR1 domain-containing protein
MKPQRDRSLHPRLAPSLHPAQLAWRTGTDGPFTSSLATVAREAIEASLSGRPFEPALQGGEASFGVCVALRSPDGHIRAYGSFFGKEFTTLVDEVVEAALGTATSTGRAEPLDASELDDLSVEICLVHAPQPMRSMEELASDRYGALVEQGGRRGIFLPKLGDLSVVEQIHLAARAGQFNSELPAYVYRLEVDRVLEPQETD